MLLKEKTFLHIVQARISRDDLLQKENHAVMVAYVQAMLAGVAKAGDLVSCKEHRAASLHYSTGS